MRGQYLVIGITIILLFPLLSGCDSLNKSATTNNHTTPFPEESGSGQAVQPAPTPAMTLNNEEPEGIPNVQTREAMLNNVNAGPDFTPDQTEIATGAPSEDTESTVSADSMLEANKPCVSNTPNAENTFTATITGTIEPTTAMTLDNEEPEGIPNVQTREAMLNNVNAGPDLTPDQTEIATGAPSEETESTVSADSMLGANKPCVSNTPNAENTFTATITGTIEPTTLDSK